MVPLKSIKLIEKLLAIEANRGSLRTLAEGLTKPRLESIERLQLGALKMALRAFGLPEDAPAATMNHQHENDREHQRLMGEWAVDSEQA